MHSLPIGANGGNEVCYLSYAHMLVITLRQWCYTAETLKESHELTNEKAGYSGIYRHEAVLAGGVPALVWNIDVP